jgi:hypothetical protein
MLNDYANTMKNFADVIEDIVWQYDIGYLDAVVKYCEDNNLEIENIVKQVKDNIYLKSMIEQEAESLNYLPKKARLEF